MHKGEGICLPPMPNPPPATPTSSSIAALLASVFVLIAGNGLLNTLVPLRATLESFPPIVVGILGSVYFIGMLAGTLAAPAIMARAGFIRAFAAFTALAIAGALAYALEVTPAFWIILRGLLGFAFAGIYGIIDSWINAKASNANRGRLYALYQIVNFGGSAIGQQMPRFGDVHGFRLFSIAAMLLAAAIIPVAMTKTDAPAEPRSIRPNVLWLMRISPIGAATVFVIGAANGSFFSLAPVYALAVGGSSVAVSWFMTATVLGSAIMVWPVGRLSDRYDRRVLVAGLSAAGVLFELLLWRHIANAPLHLAFVGVGIGCTTMVLYTLAIAHANDRAGPENVVAVSAGLLFLYCIGAIVAPTVASALMANFGVAALFGQNALLHFALAAFTVWRMMTRPRTLPVPQDRRETKRLAGMT
ncbi:MAG: MFS transporter [Methylobacteriaceae bacterium]|nr:MFS transporter [Methylobacteriaceae bacterium]